MSAASAEAVLQQTDARYRALLEANPDMIVRLTRDGTYIDAHIGSPSRVKPPIPVHSFVGRRVDDVFPADFAARHRQYRERAIDSGSTQVWEYEREFNGVALNLEARFVRSGPDEVVVHIRDVSDVKRTERRLRLSESRLNAAQRVARTGSWEHEIATGEIWWSVETYRIFGIDPEFVPRPTFELFLSRVHPNDRDRVSSAVEEAVKCKERYTADYRIVLEDGTVKLVHAEAEVLYDGAGNAVRFCGTAQDVTERDQVNRRIESLAKRLQALTEVAFDGVCVSDDGIIIEVSERFAQTLGYAPDELIGQPTGIILGASATAELAHYANRSAAPYELTAVRRDGSRLPIEATGTSLEDGLRTIRITAIRDISRRVRLEREIIDISERERNRIGRDLHDELGQTLTGVSLALQGLAGSLASRDAELAACARELTATVQGAVSELRRVARRLAPNILGHGGFGYALERLVRDVESRAGIRCRIELAGKTEVLDETAATHLYRIAQEALNNAVRHSRADAIRLRYERDGRRIRLAVADNGIGFDYAAVGDGGTGLSNMRYRARSLNGSLDVRRRAGGGTELVCVCELEPVPDPAVTS